VEVKRGCFSNARSTKGASVWPQTLRSGLAPGFALVPDLDVLFPISARLAGLPTEERLIYEMNFWWTTFGGRLLVGPRAPARKLYFLSNSLKITLETKNK
jgi:hypothetical protein